MSAPTFTDSAVIDDELTQIELRIARRADELVRAQEASARSTAEFWTRAENEIWSDRLRPDAAEESEKR